MKRPDPPRAIVAGSFVRGMRYRRNMGWKQAEVAILNPTFESTNVIREETKGWKGEPIVVIDGDRPLVAKARKQLLKSGRCVEHELTRPTCVDCDVDLEHHNTQDIIHQCPDCGRAYRVNYGPQIGKRKK